LLYQQDTDLQMLLALFDHLPRRTYLDVGAEKGSFVDAFLARGCDHAFAFEPFPRHADFLRAKYAREPRVSILEMALGRTDEEATLFVAHDAQGKELDFCHTLREFGDRQDLRWSQQVAVQCRTLSSLVQSGLLPEQAGILKIDTEGNDLEVLRGLGALNADVIALEFWDGLEDVLGRCPYSLADAVSLLGARGYHHYAAVKRNDEFEVVQMNSAFTCEGDWGNAIFLHDSAPAACGAILFEASASAARRLIEQARHFRAECDARLKIIEGFQAVSAVRDDRPERAAYDHLTLKQLNDVEDIGPATARQALVGGDLPAGGVFVGRGWYPLERFEGQTFRWVDRDAEVVLTAPGAPWAVLQIEAEVGPGVGGDRVDVSAIDANGRTLATERLHGRAILEMRIPTVPGTQNLVIRLRPDRGGRVLPQDPRKLNFRVFSLALTH
jgi:FkbM family methyltransferase